MAVCELNAYRAARCGPGKRKHFQVTSPLRESIYDHVGSAAAAAPPIRSPVISPPTGSPPQLPSSNMSLFRVAARSVARPRVAVSFQQTRVWAPRPANYSAAAGLSKEQITTRVLDVLKGFEKVDPAKVRTIQYLLYNNSPSL